MTWWVLELVFKLWGEPRGRAGGRGEVGVAPHDWLTRRAAKPNLQWSPLLIVSPLCRKQHTYEINERFNSLQYVFEVQNKILLR